MKNTNFKTKLITRIMLLVLLFTSVFSFAGCGWFKEAPLILDSEIPNLDEESVSYLLFRDLNECDYVTDIERFRYTIDGGFSVENGEKLYEAPIINLSAGFDGDGLRKKSSWIYLTKSSDISILGNFYPVKGDIGELEYEFKYIFSLTYKYNRVVYIYSNSQLVGKVYYDGQKRVKKDWIRDFLNDNLISMTIQNYSNKENISNTQNHILSYLSIGNIADSEYCSNLINYNADVSGGLKVEYGSDYYTDIVNTIHLTFQGDDTVNNDQISMQAEFYENKLGFCNLKYEIVDDLTDNGATVKIYSNEVLVGNIELVAEEEIPNEWIESFLNDNLIVLEISE